MFRFISLFLGVACAFRLMAEEPLFEAGKETEFKWKGLPKPIKVFLPTDYDPTKRHPCIFYYHGTNGLPNTETMVEVTQGKTYVVVGMEYHIRGKVSLPQEEMVEYEENNFKTYKAVRKWVSQRVAIDPKRVYMAGASKGGWITSLQGDRDMENLAGLIILMGGRHWSQKPLKNAKPFAKKAIFVGVGDMDRNVLSSRWATQYYRKLGATVTLEEFPGLGHQLSFDSGLLADWLEVEGGVKANPDAHKAAIDAWAKEQVEEIRNLEDDLERYQHLKMVAANPKSLFATVDTRKALLVLWREAIAKGKPGLKELRAEQAFNRVLGREYAWWLKQNERPITKTQYLKNLRTVRAIHKSYSKIVSDYSGTRCATLAQASINRMSTAIKNMEEMAGKLDSAKTVPSSRGGQMGAGRELNKRR